MAARSIRYGPGVGLGEVGCGGLGPTAAARHDPLTQPRTSSWTSLPICHDADRESAYDPAEQALAEAKERGRMVVDTRIWYTTCAHQRHHAEMGWAVCARL